MLPRHSSSSCEKPPKRALATRAVYVTVIAAPAGLARGGGVGPNAHLWWRSGEGGPEGGPGATGGGEGVGMTQLYVSSPAQPPPQSSLLPALLSPVSRCQASPFWTLFPSSCAYLLRPSHRPPHLKLLSPPRCLLSHPIPSHPLTWAPSTASPTPGVPSASVSGFSDCPTPIPLSQIPPVPPPSPSSQSLPFLPPCTPF